MMNMNKPLTRYEVKEEKQSGHPPQAFARCLLTAEALLAKEPTFCISLAGTNETCKIQKTEVLRLINARTPLRAAGIRTLQVLLTFSPLNPDMPAWDNYLISAPSQLLKPEYRPFIKPARLVSIEEWFND